MHYQTLIPSPLGDLIAIASDDHLLMLEFADCEELEERLSVIAKNFSVPVKNDVAIQEKRKNSISWLDCFGLAGGGVSRILSLTATQLWEYFEWKRTEFTIPLSVDGTDFQRDAWKWLEKIPYSETRSYWEQARMIGRDRAVRAIGWANHNNRIVIIIPCHRVIGASGKLVGYGGGMERKIWLLEHEKRNK